jgi:cobalt-precorrin-5B (C1)-methyltransferase
MATSPEPSLPSNLQPRAGYTLPVFACAAAIAALRWLSEELSSLPSVPVDLLEPAETVTIAIEQVARLTSTCALAITRSDPGDNLDLTRHTPVWAMVERITHQAETINDKGNTSPIPHPSSFILLKGGEGIGRQVNVGDRPAIYAYARRLIEENLTRYLQPDEGIQVTIILPEGRALAERTSNAAFGVVDGLSLLGTSGIAQPLSSPDQLAAYQMELQRKAKDFKSLVFCVGENGLDLALSLGIHPDRLIKTANWLGPMLVEAGLQGIESILLFGYHGKLLKLAGGIFHTHHHVADGRQEILTAHCAVQGLPLSDVQVVLTSATAEAAMQHLRSLDAATGSDWIKRIYGAIANQIDRRAEAYIRTHSERQVKIGSVLFDRDRKIIIQSETGATFLSQDLLR